MANFRLGVAAAGIFLSALVLLQLISFVQDQSPYPNFNVGKKLWQGRSRQFGDDVFLLGAGRADITGYYLFTFYWLSVSLFG